MRLKLKSKKGASAVEFALILPVLALILFGIIEFSIALYDKAIITNASREGGRAGIVARWDNNVSPAIYDPLTAAEIQTVVNNYLSNHLVTFAGPTSASFNPPITPCPPTGNSQTSSGSELVVTVVYPYTFLVLPKLPKFATKLTTINISAETRMRCE